jgi:RNA polymerase sigma-70 factor (ECF subfamily)
VAGPKPPAQALNGSLSAGFGVSPAPFAVSASLDDESRDWLRSLTADSCEEAVVRLRALLLRATRFEISRRRAELWDVDDGELDELACAATDAALTSVLHCLDRYRGDSHFTTWAAKYAILEAAVRLRKLAWRSERSALCPPRREASDAQLSPDLGAILSADQRHVFETLTFHRLPIDVLAEQLQTTRADVYETLQAARRVLRGALTKADRA